MYIGQMTPDLKKKRGVGMRISASGILEEGFWDNDKPNGPGRCLYKKGSYYLGNFTNGNRQSYGKYVNFNGDTYEGYYRQDYRWGEGIKHIDKKDENVIGFFVEGYVNRQY